MLRTIFLYLTALSCMPGAYAQEANSLQAIRSAVSSLASKPVHLVAVTPEGKLKPRLELWWSGPNVLVVETGRVGIERVFGKNKSYGFMLSRPSESDPWTIVRLLTPEKFDAERGALVDGLRFYCAVESQFILDVLPGESSVNVVRTSEGLLEIDFHTHKYTPRARFIDKGKVVLDPALEYAVKGFECTVALGNESALVSGVCKYDKQSSAGIRPVRRDIRFPGSPEVSSCEIQSITFEDTPSEVFTLSHFGLSEPEEASNSLSKHPVVAIVFSLGVLVTIAMLYTLRRNKSAL